jgi:hypothetical protein
MAKQALQAYRCGCEVCAVGRDRRVIQAHEHINLLLTRLDEQQRRWYVATLAEQYGLRKGGVRVMAQVTGISEKTIRRGLREAKGGLADCAEDRVRQPGAGRPAAKSNA